MGRVIPFQVGVAGRDRRGEVKGGRAWSVDAGLGGHSGEWDWGGVGGVDVHVRRRRLAVRKDEKSE